MIIVNFQKCFFEMENTNNFNNILKIKNIKIYQIKNKKHPMVIASYQLIYN